MKYRKPRIGTGITPTVQMIRAQKQTVLGALKRGEIDCTYPLWVVVASAFRTPIPEELNQRLMSSPLGLFYEFDVRALTDYTRFMDTVAEAFEKQSR